MNICFLALSQKLHARGISAAQGNITLAEISTTMPYGNWVVVKQLTGEEVVATLEHAVSDLEHPAGRFVQVGVHV